MWPESHPAENPTFREDGFSGFGTQYCRNEQIYFRFSPSLKVRRLLGEEFFDEPASFGWVIEKGQVPGIHFMHPGVWHQLHSPARNI
jgi:hypothetical protein